MIIKYVLISIPEKFETKFYNMINNINRVNTESEGITIEGEYGEKPEYAAIPTIKEKIWLMKQWEMFWLKDI